MVVSRLGASVSLGYAGNVGVRSVGADGGFTSTEAGMGRDDERLVRSHHEPIVGGLPDVPGILAAIRLTPGLGIHLRGLADELLVNDFPGATIERYEREMLDTSTRNR